MADQITGGASSATREFWSVLFGAGATLVALLVCAGPWQRSLVHWNSEEHGYIASQAFRLVDILFKILSPQVWVSWILTAGYEAILLRQRLMKIAPARRAGLIAKRLCPMVVWIGIDEATYDSFFSRAGSTYSVEATAGEDDTAAVTEHERRTVENFFDSEQHLKEAPNLNVAVPWPGSKLPPTEEDPAQKTYYFCLQCWDKKTSMWKEAMVVTEAPGTDQNICRWMGTVKARPWWARALLLVQGLGYQASVFGRFVHHLRVSPLEVMCAWISLVVVVEVEAGFMPLVVVPSNQGIHLRLDLNQFRNVLQYYINNRHARKEELARKDALTCINLWSFVFCILSTFFLCLILLPPLIYYYYKLPTSILSFVSLSLFPVLTGAGITSFALSLFSSPHEVTLVFTNFPTFTMSPSSYTCMHVITLSLFLIGLAAYLLALIDTTINWPLFETRDGSFFRFIIPHIGS